MLPSRFTALKSHANLNDYLYTMRFDYNYIHRSGGLSALFDCYCRGWLHVKLRPSRRTFCVHHTTMHQFTVIYEAIHVGYTVSCNLLFWRNDWIFLFTTSVTWEWNGY